MNVSNQSQQPRRYDGHDRTLLDCYSADGSCSPRASATQSAGVEAAGIVVSTKYRDGIVWLLGGFVLCPCHLPLTLWLLTSLLATTALKNAILSHRLALGIALTIGWLLATIRGLILMRNANRPGRRSTAITSWGIIALLAVAVPRLGAQQTHGPAVEDSVKATEFARRQGLLKADTVLLSRLTAPEFYEVSRLGQIRTRATNMLEVATGALKLKTVNFDSLAVRVYGDVAILTGISDNTGEFRGTPFSGKIRYTRIFVRRDGRWQAVAMHHTTIA